MSNKRRYKRIKEMSKSQAWRGADIIGSSGFGVTDINAYIKRDDLQKNLRKLRNSNIWKELTSNTGH
jgi:hypothetical protein